LLKTFRQSLSLLGTRRFGTFWFASLLSSIGTWAQQVAEPWLLLTLGASAFLVGVDSFAINAPVWLLTLAGGALADRADRRRVIAGFQSLEMLCPAVIVALLIAGAARPWMIVALSGTPADSPRSWRRSASVVFSEPSRCWRGRPRSIAVASARCARWSSGSS
jgi:hypothetical protein